MSVQEGSTSASNDPALSGDRIHHFAVHSSWFHTGDYRLDARTYAGGSAEVITALEASGLPLEPIQSLCGTMWHPVQTQARTNFKRIYTDREHGVPFVSSRSMFGFPLRPERFLSRRMQKLSDLMVPEGWLVVSRSGTVGNPLYINKSLARCAISDHAIRIEPTRVPAGYLYAFLSTSSGQVLMAKNIFGSTVEELEPKHIGSILLPRLGSREDEIHNQIVQAYSLRDRGNEVLDAVEQDLYTLLGVDAFSERDVEYLGRSLAPRAFAISSESLKDRLDASYYLPVVRSVHHKLRAGKYPLVRLGDRVSRIYVAPRFARIYVPAEYGVPFLQGSQMPLMRQYNLQYISRSRTRRLENWIIDAGWMLVTCSGTIGRVAVSTQNQAGWAASQHILRVVPDPGQYLPGFLWAFLSTDYGQHQLRSKIYGGVVDELTESDMAEVMVPDVPVSFQRDIDDVVRNAYETRDTAQALEAKAIRAVEDAIRNNQKAQPQAS
jgi:type I restriction enzyme S subunit